MVVGAGEVGPGISGGTGGGISGLTSVGNTIDITSNGTARNLEVHPFSMVSAAGNLITDYTVTTGFATFLTTANLSLGLWLVTMVAQAENLTASSNLEFRAVVGTALASFSGCVATEVGTGPGVVIGSSAVLSFLANITQAGTLAFQAKGSTSDAVFAETASGASPATGYTALRISPVD